MPKAPDTTSDIPSLKAKAELGDKSFQLHFGWCYEHGEGVKQDWAEAAKWYQSSAEQGHLLAQQFLGELLFTGGHGLKQDYAEAYFWFMLAGKDGSKAAVKMQRDAADQLSSEEIAAVDKRVAEWKPTPAPAAVTEKK